VPVLDGATEEEQEAQQEEQGVQTADTQVRLKVRCSAVG
jgi:hypothetical protein